MGWSIRRYLLALLSRGEAAVSQEDWKRLRFSYAQYGEDLIAEALLPDAAGFYAEVGAFHPVQISNTYLFYRRGWQGIVIDPNPRAVALFERRRPRDIVVGCAVSDEEGPVFLDVTSSHEAAHLRGAGVDGTSSQAPRRSYRVTCRRLDKILCEYLPPGQNIDFLTVDCEGYDLNVLRSNDWEKFRPRVVAVEDWESRAESQICRFLAERGYSHVIDANITRIFARQKSI
jgi:FkbM family methyltransferase